MKIKTVYLVFLLVIHVKMKLFVKHAYKMISTLHHVCVYLINIEMPMIVFVKIVNTLVPSVLIKILVLLA